MKNKKCYLYLSEAENSLVLKSLMDMRNSLISQGRYTDGLDMLIPKIINAPRKKFKVQ